MSELSPFNSLTYWPYHSDEINKWIHCLSQSWEFIKQTKSVSSCPIFFLPSRRPRPSNIRIIIIILICSLLVFHHFLPFHRIYGQLYRRGQFPMNVWGILQDIFYSPFRGTLQKFVSVRLSFQRVLSSFSLLWFECSENFSELSYILRSRWLPTVKKNNIVNLFLSSTLWLVFVRKSVQFAEECQRVGVFFVQF